LSIVATNLAGSIEAPGPPADGEVEAEADVDPAEAAAVAIDEANGDVATALVGDDAVV
jgi:hypothetical protein